MIVHNPKVEVNSLSDAKRIFGEGSEAARVIEEMWTLRVRVDIKTTNPLNGSQGMTRKGAFGRAAKRKKDRETTRNVLVATMMARQWSPVWPVELHVCRVAPSNGLDPHDGLGAALKGVVDGITDALGLKNDRDPRLKHTMHTQRRGRPKEWAVEITLKGGAE